MVPCDTKNNEKPPSIPSPLMGEGQDEGDNFVFLPLTFVLSHKGRGNGKETFSRI
jgi:hypothetical protein